MTFATCAQGFDAAIRGAFTVSFLDFVFVQDLSLSAYEVIYPISERDMASRASRKNSGEQNHEIADLEFDHDSEIDLDRSHSPMPLLPMQSLGEPSSKTPLTSIDAATILCTRAAFAISVVVILNHYVAVQLRANCSFSPRL